MDHPQWNFFQPPISESSLLDYNRSFSNFSSLSNNYSNSNNSSPSNNSSQSNNRYNGFYDSPSNSHIRNTKPPSTTALSPTSSMSSPSISYSSASSYANSSGPNYSSQSHMQSRNSDNQHTSGYYSSSSTNSSSQYTPTPPISDFKIGTFTLNANGYPCESNNQESSNNTSLQSNSSYQHNGSASSQSARETGIIEKLLQTYGFIQCCERQARLFFHFSQFDGNTEHLRIGDPVEFEVTFDRRTGKPIASSVTKISPEVVLSEERVVGIVTTELKSENSGEQQGRITYENRGECFFLPYSKEDVEGYVTLKPGDKVSFQIATNQRSGNLAARHVRLENPVEPVKYQGVVCAIKDSYGFIERADVVDEIFFHFSEAKTIPEGLKLGDDVEFLIQTRNNKEVATNMERLLPGTVVFEDTNPEEIRGQVLKPVEKALRQSQKDPLTGRIRYRGKDRSEVEVKFGERDQQGDFTLRHGDWVKFNIATDRRDHLQKATKISLLDESFNVSGEKREQGLISCLKEGFGFIKCADRDTRMHFHYNELLEPQKEISIGEEVEFTVISDQTAPAPSKQSAIRIRRLNPGTVKFEVKIQEGLQGEVTLEPLTIPASPNYDNSEASVQPGNVTFYIESVKQTINFYPIDGQRMPCIGDRVEFSMYLIKRTKERVALDLKILPPLINSINPSATGVARQSMVGSGRTFERGSVSNSTLASSTSLNKITFQTRSNTSKNLGIVTENSYANSLALNQNDNNYLGKNFENIDKPEKSISNPFVENSQLNPFVEKNISNPFVEKSISNPFADNLSNPFADKNSSNPFAGNASNPFVEKKITNNSEKNALSEHLIEKNLPTSFLENYVPNQLGEMSINSNFEKNIPDYLGENNISNNFIEKNVSNSFIEISNDFADKEIFNNSISNSINNFFEKNLSNGFENESSNFEKSKSSTFAEKAITNNICEQNISKKIEKTIVNQNENESALNIVKDHSIYLKPAVSDSLPLKQTQSPKSLSSNNNSTSNHNTGASLSRQIPIHQGFIATLKDTFGFIETINHDKEIFFHFSNVEDNVNDLELGQEVEYTISSRTGPGGKLSAENVHVMPCGTLITPKILGEVFEGTVLRSMRSVNPEQQEYCGEVCVGKEEDKSGHHHFGITGLVNKKELLQPGDLVNFQLDEDGWAVNIRAVRKKLLATVEAVKGQYGFLNFEAEEGKKLFFHQSEVKDGIILTPGDEVQFVIITNLKTGKSSACNISRLMSSNGPSQRPERLVSRLKSLSKDTTKPRIEVIRQPKGPDGTKGFKVQRIFS